jgi:hypothetical protein
MEVLLAWDDLQTDSEDTVLATAAAWLHSNNGTDAAKLLKLIRAPRLSPLCLTAVAPVILGDLVTPSDWLAAARVQASSQSLGAAQTYAKSPVLQRPLLRKFPAWLLPPRTRVSAEAQDISTFFEVSASQIKDMCTAALQEQGDQIGESHLTPPICGVQLRCNLIARYKDGAGVRPGIDAGFAVNKMYTRNPVASLQLGAVLELLVGTKYRFRSSGQSLGSAHIVWWLFMDCFRLGFMAEGWDQAKWDAQGHPPVFKVGLRVHKVI